MAARMTAAAFDAREARAERRHQAWFVLAVIAAALYPLLDQALGINRLGSWIAIFVFIILAMGLNIVVGYAGLLDLGYAAFFIIGAYANAFLTSPSSVFVRNGLVPEFLQHFWPAMAVSWVIAALFGVLLGAPTLRTAGRLPGDRDARLRRDRAQLLRQRGAGDRWAGRRQPDRDPAGDPLPGGADISFSTTDQRSWYWLILLVGVFSVLVINRLYDSRLGRSWQAIREDEIAASSMGINLVKTKLWAFALGASFSGFAGSVYAGYLTVVYPDQFEFSVSVILLAMVILGGLGNIYGVILGGLLIQSFDRILAEELNGAVHWIGDQTGLAFLQQHQVTQDRLLIFGLALVLMMLVRPAGLFPNARRRAELEPESDSVRVQEDQRLYDIRHENEAAVGERA
jgi:branched-chain amino acid transport system permease protein